MAELNAKIREWEDQDDQRRITGRIRTIGQDLADERPHLNPLPHEVFDPGLVLHPPGGSVRDGDGADGEARSPLG